jgi:hypothetical protein
MVKVIATSKGYFGGIVRDIGESFAIPDELWSDKKKRPSWARIAGGEVEAAVTSAPAGATSTETKPAATNVVEVPADWSSLHGSKRKQLAKAITGEAVADLAIADNIISAYVEANKPAPFADAPAPQTVAQAVKATGGIEPDWIAPGEPTAVAD